MPYAATRIQFEIIILREVNEKEEDKYHGNIYMWNQRKGYKLAYRQYKNGVTDVEIKLYSDQRGSVNRSNKLGDCG